MPVKEITKILAKGKVGSLLQQPAGTKASSIFAEGKRAVAPKISLRAQRPKFSLWRYFKSVVYSLLPKKKSAPKAFKSSPEMVITINSVTPQKHKMRPTFEARMKKWEIDRQLHLPYYIDNFEIDKNIIKTAKNNSKGWDYNDMKKYYEEQERIAYRQAFETLQANRVAKYIKPDDVQLKPQGSKFTIEQYRAVASYQDNYSYNSYLREGTVNPNEVKEICIMDDIVKNAPKTTEDCIVYRNIKTAKPWLPDEPLDFTKELKVGNIITDPSFLSTARKDCGLLRNFDSLIQFPDTPVPIGYAERITIPKNSQVIDCARGGIYPEEIILGRNSMCRIDKIDEANRVIHKTFLGYAN